MVLRMVFYYIPVSEKSLMKCASTHHEVGGCETALIRLKEIQEGIDRMMVIEGSHTSN